MCNLKTIHCSLPTESPAKIQPAITSYLAGELHWQSVLSDNPGSRVFHFTCFFGHCWPGTDFSIGSGKKEGFCAKEEFCRKLTPWCVDFFLTYSMYNCFVSLLKLAKPHTEQLHARNMLSFWSKKSRWCYYCSMTMKGMKEKYCVYRRSL